MNAYKEHPSLPDDSVLHSPAEKVFQPLSCDSSLSGIAAANFFMQKSQVQINL